MQKKKDLSPQFKFTQIWFILHFFLRSLATLPPSTVVSFRTVQFRGDLAGAAFSGQSCYLNLIKENYQEQKIEPKSEEPLLIQKHQNLKLLGEELHTLACAVLVRLTFPFLESSASVSFHFSETVNSNFFYQRLV